MRQSIDGYRYLPDVHRRLCNSGRRPLLGSARYELASRFGRINMAVAIPTDPGIIAAYAPVHPSIPGAGLGSRHVVWAAEHPAVDPNVVRGRRSWKPNCHVSAPRSASFEYGALKSMRQATVPLRPKDQAFAPRRGRDRLCLRRQFPCGLLGAFCPRCQRARREIDCWR